METLFILSNPFPGLFTEPQPQHHSRTGQSERESHPDSRQPPTENETAKVPYGQRYNKIGYKCNNHHRFHIRDAAQGIGKVNLQPIAELVNQEREEESGNHARHFRIVRKPSPYLTAKCKDDTQQHHYLTVPKSNVEIGFWLESDRMLELAFSEQSLEVQRAVVMEEFKQRCLNQPYGDVGHLLRPLAYQTHPYRWPTIGKDLSHIANATLDEVKEFFFRFYAPNNAVLAVTGNISWEETVRLTEKWFAPIPRRNVPVRQLPQEVVQTAERRQTVERNVPLDALFMAYHMCSREDADYYAFDILSDILSNGRSSRLTRRLVQEQKFFSSLDAYISGTRDAGLLHISGKPSAGVSLEQAEAAVRKELEELKSGFVGEQELEKVKNKFESTQIFGNINYLNVATNLAWFELTGQAEDIDREVDNYRSVTAEQLHRVAQQTFRDENGIVLYYQKENL